MLDLAAESDNPGWCPVYTEDRDPARPQNVGLRLNYALLTINSYFWNLCSAGEICIPYSVVRCSYGSMAIFTIVESAPYY